MTKIIFPLRTLMTPDFNLKGPGGQDLLKLEGPTITSGFGGDVDFTVTDIATVSTFFVLSALLTQ